MQHIGDHFKNVIILESCCVHAVAQVQESLPASLSPVASNYQLA